MLRLRLPELLEERNLTPYRLARASGGRISLTTAHRLVRQRGRVRQFNGAVLEALCDVLGVQIGDLFQRSRGRGASPMRSRGQT